MEGRGGDIGGGGGPLAALGQSFLLAEGCEGRTLASYLSGWAVALWPDSWPEEIDGLGLRSPPGALGLE